MDLFFNKVINLEVSYLIISCILSIGCIKVSMLAVDCGFDPRIDQSKDCTIGVCCFSAKSAALRDKSKYWLAQNQDNMSTHRLLYQ